MQAWVIAKISIVWFVFISRIRCAIKAGIRSVAEQKLKQSKLMFSGFFHFFFHEWYQFFGGVILNSLSYKGQYLCIPLS